MEELEKEYGYKDAHFEYVQQSIRRLCLTYGAGLIYSSAKKEVNTRCILDYIHQKLYSFDFHHKQSHLEKESLIFPAGWDSLTKINVDFENNQNLTKDFEEPFEEIIKIPKILQQSIETTLDSAIIIDEDQAFLIKHKDLIEKDGSKDPTSGKSGGLLQSLQKLTDSKSSPTSGGLSNPTNTTNLTSNTKETPERPPPSTLPLKTEPGTDTQPSSEHQVLADFFNSLIHKDRASGGTGATQATKKPPVDLKSLAKTTNTSPVREDPKQRKKP